MNELNFKSVLAALVVLSPLSFAGVGRPPVVSAAPPGSGAACNPWVAARVYKPSRLLVKDPCKVVTGTIEELDANEDGDEHMLLKLDPGQENLLNKKNLKKKNGNLVIEVVCANPTTVPSAAKACKGYKNQIAIPKVGQHVTVTGAYVIDTHNGWAEIHPVSRIE